MCPQPITFTLITLAQHVLLQNMYYSAVRARIRNIAVVSVDSESFRCCRELMLPCVLEEAMFKKFMEHEQEGTQVSAEYFYGA